MLPKPLHPTIARHCIKHATNMVTATASFLAPEMKQLHGAAVDANMTVMNEVGLDPGIARLLAMECFDEVRQKDGKVLLFVSYYGGLPAPAHANNPIRYKVRGLTTVYLPKSCSWNPLTAFVNCMDPARYLENDKSKLVRHQPGEGDLDIMRHDVGIEWPNGKKEMRNIDMVAYGDPNGYSAMAKTVGYTAPIAAKMILQGEIQAKGVELPFSQKIYGPILRRLKNEGINCKKTSSKDYS